MVRGSATIGPYVVLRTLRDVQVGSAFVAIRPGENGFEKRVVLHCDSRRRLTELAAEARSAAWVSHASIAHVLDVGAHEDLAYVTVEHLEGRTLHSLLLRRDRLSWRFVANVVAAVARALAYAHGRRDDEGRLLGIVHRRVSPRRIVVGPGATACLTGLGVSWAWPNPTGFGSPEEDRGEPIDGRADVFALGRVLQRCVSSVDMPPALSELSDWATHSLPEHRPTAAALNEELCDILRGDAEPWSDDTVFGSGLRRPAR